MAKSYRTLGFYPEKGEMGKLERDEESLNPHKKYGLAVSPLRYALNSPYFMTVVTEEH